MSILSNRGAEAVPILIVNADDFGLSAGTNEGILKAHADGIVTSSSLMVYGCEAMAAADARRLHPTLSFGLHLEFGEWIFKDGNWEARQQRVSLEDPAAIRHEVIVQLETFRRIMGEEPSHVDSHQHMHLREPVRSIVEEIFRPLRMPIRQMMSWGGYYGGFYGQTSTGAPLAGAVTTEALLDVIAALPAEICELGCHPGLDSQLESPYCQERLTETATLCDPEVRRAIAERGIRLMSFAEVRQPYRAIVDAQHRADADSACTAVAGGQP